MRMATFNILHGRSVHDGAVELGRLAESVRLLDADVLALQEVDLDQPRSSMADLTALAAEAMGAVTPPVRRGALGHTRRDVDGGDGPRTARHGRLRHRATVPVPGAQLAGVRLPRIPVTFPMYVREPKKVLMVREEPRAAMVAQLDTPLGTLTVANTHLSFVPGWNRLQLRHLVRDLRGFDGPRVLMGDLNMTPPTTGRWVGCARSRSRPPSPVATHTASSTTSSPTIRRCGPTTARLPSCRSRITVHLLWTFRGRNYVGWRSWRSA